MTTHTTKLKHHIFFGCFRLLLFVAGFFPRDVKVPVLCCLGRSVFGLLGKTRCRMVATVKTMFPDKSDSDCTLIARECLGHFLVAGFDMAEWTHHHNALIRCDRADLERLLATYNEGNGIVLITAHLGNWELLPRFLSHHGITPNSVARRIKIPSFHRFVEKRRLECGGRLLYRSESMKNIIKLLRSGQSLGLLPDQDIQGLDGIFVDFFGQPAFTPTSPVVLAAMTGAPLVPIFCIRQGLRYKIQIGTPIRVEKEARKNDQLRYYTEMWSALFEEKIRQHPEQWVLMHNRWRTQA
jgi:Kdo2-lipid IVA lauroyltransferase/acyltransferase